MIENKKPIIIIDITNADVDGVSFKKQYWFSCDDEKLPILFKTRKLRQTMHKLTCAYSSLYDIVFRWIP